MSKQQSSRPPRWLRGLFVVATLFVALTGAGRAGAAESIRCGDKPIFLAFFDFGLRHFVKDGQAAGIDKDFVDEMARRSGCRFITEVMTKARIYADLESGALDMSVAGVATREREKSIWFITTLRTKFLSVVRRPAGESARTVDAFLANPKLTLGIIRGSVYSPAQQAMIDKLSAQGRIDESRDIAASVAKFEEGKVDAILASPAIYRMYFTRPDAPDAPLIYDWFPNEDVVFAGLMLSKARFSAEDVAAWRALIRDMYRDGTAERINARYLSKAEARMLAVPPD